MGAFGVVLMTLAVLGIVAGGLYVAWEKGKLTRFTFLPKPPQK